MLIDGGVWAVGSAGIAVPGGALRPAGAVGSGLPMRGREVPLAAVASVLRDGSSGVGHVMVVEGMAGSGRTRFVDEVCRIAERQGYVVGFGSSVDGAAIAAGAELDGSGDRPLLVCVDDIERADEVAIVGLVELVRRSRERAVSWVLAIDPSVSARSGCNLVASLASEGSTVIALPALDRGAVDELIGDLVGARPSQTLSDFVALADGEPAAVVRLVHNALAEGTIRVDGDTAHVVSTRLPQAVRQAHAGDTRRVVSARSACRDRRCCRRPTVVVRGRGEHAGDRARGPARTVRGAHRGAHFERRRGPFVVPS